MDDDVPMDHRRSIGWGVEKLRESQVAVSSSLHKEKGVARFIKEAEARILSFLRARPGLGDGFVCSDYATVHSALSYVAQEELATGPVFCEWGSGIGGVTSLASMLGFEAYGIEIQADLVEAARELAGDFDLDVLFAHGSFVPPGGEPLADSVEYPWWDTGAASAYEELELAPETCDLFFAYPWPGEEQVISQLFDRYAAVGALLLTYHGGVEDIRLRRKTGAEMPLSCGY